MWTLENTEGFTEADLALINQAVAALMARGIDEDNADGIVNNNWDPDGPNTVESLTVL